MSELERIKYCAARFVYRRQNFATPIGKISWREWWELRFKDDYHQYVQNRIKDSKA